ncbi:MAG: MarR family transcriptional regulator [Oscillospiraceae bacterium]|nr:MarR family transcriptional regulator [Oscillospiraceae bacterium]
MDGKYDALRLRNQLCFPLYLCSKEITRRYQPLLEKLDLTYTQYVVMMYYWEMGSSTAKELSGALLLDPSTLTPILRKLEKKGYLKRSRNPEDERSILLSLTSEGLALQDRALAVPAEMANCLGLKEEEAYQLGMLLGKILTNVEKEL